jgi:hypothetical protein
LNAFVDFISAETCCQSDAVKAVAKNGSAGNGRIGAVKSRSQFKGPNGNFIKRDATTGRFMDQKTSSAAPFKGVRKEK